VRANSHFKSPSKIDKVKTAYNSCGVTAKPSTIVSIFEAPEPNPITKRLTALPPSTETR
jgi:hypothetical protein